MRLPVHWLLALLVDAVDALGSVLGGSARDEGAIAELESDSKPDPLIKASQYRSSRASQWAAIAATMLLHTAALAQSAPDVIRGVVRDTKGSPVRGAVVRATRAPDRAVFSAMSDSAGAFVIGVDSGTGDYLLHVSAPDSLRLSTFRLRLTRTSTHQSVFDVVVVLQKRSAQALAAVTVRAPRPTASPPNDVMTPGPGAVERPVFGVAAHLLPDQLGQLNVIGATVPGITVLPNGISALGAAADQNGTTMNGMAFPGQSIPRDVRVVTRVSTSTFDPARGWFGGAETSIEIQPGEVIRTLHGSLTLDDPRLQRTSYSPKHDGQEFASVIAGLGGDGYAARDRIAYSFGLQGTRRETSIATPLALSANVLSRLGLSREGVQDALSAFDHAGVPVSRGQAISHSPTSSGSAILRLNTPGFDTRRGQPARQSLGLVAYAFRQVQDDAAASTAALPSTQLRSDFDVRSLQALFSKLTENGAILSVRSSFNLSEQRYAPYFNFPSGEIVIASESGDNAEQGVLRFGGGSDRMERRSQAWETQGRATFFWPGRPRHAIDLAAALRWDEQRLLDESGMNGQFAFANLLAFVENQPALYSRTLAVRRENASTVNAFASIGDNWRMSPRVRLALGMRAEMNRFVERPSHNAAVESAFHERNDVLPNLVGLSPRVGFQWHYASRPAVSGAFMTGLGMLPYFATGIIRGGIGAFRSFVGPSVASGAMGVTGLPDAERRIACVGAASPQPDWRNLSGGLLALPSVCRSQAGQEALHSEAPNVQLLDRQFRAATSWRANVGWSERRPWLAWTIDATVAWNVNQPGQRDLNFDNVLKFRTSDEHRPVFVSVAGIDARSGVLATATSRRTSAFGTVLQTRSDLASVAKQLTLTLVPSVFEATGKFYLSAAYTIGSVREAARGIDRTAFDAPMVRSWQRSPLDIRHAILIQAGVAGKAASFTMYGRFASGQPFTPVVDRDVNGDGLANDRAFLFDPATPSTNGQLASELGSLLSAAPRGIRACLIRQTGRAASPGSCEGPWTATLNAHLAVRLARSSDSELSISIANVPALLDQLLNRDQLRGWGSQLSPDAVLLRVREFDAVTQRYAYSVNPRFGSTHNQRGTALNPFRISFSCRVSLGPSRQLQEVRRLLNPALRSLRDGRLDRRGFISRLRRLGPEPYRTLMEFSDSLLLNEDQLRALAEADVGYHARADEVWGRLADSLTARAQEFDENAALRRQERSIDEVWEIARLHVQSTLGVVLTDLQRSMLPWPTNVLFTSASPIVGVRTHDFRRP